MVYNTQNYWVFGLCPSSDILGTGKHNVWEIGSVSVLGRGGGGSYSVGSLRNRLALSKGSDKVANQLFRLMYLNSYPPRIQITKFLTLYISPWPFCFRFITFMLVYIVPCWRYSLGLTDSATHSLTLFLYFRLHRRYYTTVELELSNSRTVGSRTLEPSTLDLSNSRIR
jgi:hypothetical protein